MTDWEARGCANLTPAESDRIFFPEDNKGSKEAKALCKPCPIKDTCLAFGKKMSNGHSVWGGVDARNFNPPAARAEKMSDEDVIAIRRQLEAGIPIKEIAKASGRHRKAIHNILNGLTYQHVAA